MDSDGRLLASVPDAIAVELQDAGLADQLPRTRDLSALVDVVVVGIGVSTTLITLAEGPGAFAALKKRVGSWVQRDAPRVSISVRGPAGSVTIDLTNAKDLDASALARTLELAISTDSTADGA